MLSAMKALPIELRERVIAFVEEGGSKVEAAHRFRISRRSVYRFLEAKQNGTLKPKTSWGSWRKLDPQKLARYIQKHPDATLKQMQEVFHVSHQAIWKRLALLGITLKKSHSISREK